LKLGFLTTDFRIPPRKFVAVALLNSGTLAWFFLIQIYIGDIFGTLTQNDPYWGYYNIGSSLFYGSAIFWAIIGSFIGGRVNSRKLLIAWITLGTFSTILLTLFQGPIFGVVVSVLLGVSLGLGLPSCMALIADYTNVEERGRVSGLIILGTFITAFTTLIIVRLLDLGIIHAILLFAIVRSISLLALLFDRCDRARKNIHKKPKFARASYREFSFYLFPWVMFAIAAGLASNLIPQTENYEAATSMGMTLRYIAIAVFGFLAGVAADKFGRKQPIIIGLIMLGVSFALIGFLGMNEMNVVFYLAISGIAWGSFLVVFLAVPGDLSDYDNREKFYGLGYILPVAVLFSLSAIPGIAIFSNFSVSSFSQLLSIILFLSIIPVLRAKETLPKQKIIEREMKEHIEKIEKIVQESKKE
jgi:MFS family permease